MNESFEKIEERRTVCQVKMMFSECLLRMTETEFIYQAICQIFKHHQPIGKQAMSKQARNDN